MCIETDAHRPTLARRGRLASRRCSMAQFATEWASTSSTRLRSRLSAPTCGCPMRIAATTRSTHATSRSAAAPGCESCSRECSHQAAIAPARGSPRSCVCAGDLRERTGANRAGPRAETWGSRGRRFKSCQPDIRTAGQGPFRRWRGGPFRCRRAARGAQLAPGQAWTPLDQGDAGLDRSGTRNRRQRRYLWRTCWGTPHRQAMQVLG